MKKNIKKENSRGYWKIHFKKKAEYFKQYRADPKNKERRREYMRSYMRIKKEKEREEKLKNQRENLTW